MAGRLSTFRALKKKERSRQRYLRLRASESPEQREARLARGRAIEAARRADPGVRERKLAANRKWREKFRLPSGKLALPGAVVRISIRECATCGRLFWWGSGHPYGGRHCCRACVPPPRKKRPKVSCLDCGVSMPFGARRCPPCAAIYRASTQSEEAKQKRKVAARKADRERFGKYWRGKARAYGAHYEKVDRTKIFDRDDWICYLCGRPVPRGLLRDCRAKDAPTIDHVVPISKGGAHAAHNIRLAHRGCNSRKQSRIQ